MAPTVRGALAGPGGAGRLTIRKKYFLKVRRRTREPVPNAEDECLGPDHQLVIPNQKYLANHRKFEKEKRLPRWTNPKENDGELGATRGFWFGRYGQSRSEKKAASFNPGKQSYAF